MDSGHYLLHGVMDTIRNPHTPDGIFEEMEEELLDAADRVIEYHRKRDRLFDVECDSSMNRWQWHHIEAERVRVGMCIQFPREPVPINRSGGALYGEVVKVDARPNGLTFINIELNEVGRADPLRGPDMRARSFNMKYWDEDCRVMVPIPVDGQTLGEYSQFIDEVRVARVAKNTKHRSR